MKNIPPPKQSTISQYRSKTSSRALWIVFFLFMSLYGVFAIDGGLRVLSDFNGEYSHHLTQLPLMVDRGENIYQNPLTLAGIPLLGKIIAAMTSDQYMYSSESALVKIFASYHSSWDNRLSMGVHMSVGLLIMILGSLQFIPSFRQRYPKWHRSAGKLYLLAGALSVLGSGYYLINTPIAKIFNTFAFYYGLWLMWLGAIVAMTLGTIAIKRRNFVAHMGWQALGFGFFLTAPIQRYAWVLLSPIFSEGNFLITNFAVNVFLFSITTLLGYTLFLFNRKTLTSSFQPNQPSPIRPSLALALKGLSIICIVLIWYFFVIKAGFEQQPYLVSMLPDGILAIDRQLFTHPFLPVLFAALYTLTFAGFVFSLTESSLSPRLVHSTQTMFIGSLGMGLILLFWGYQQGSPSMERNAGGTLYVWLGLLSIVYVALSAWAYRRGYWGWIREWSLFLIASISTLALGPILLAFLKIIDFVPAMYISEGHAYIIAYVVPMTVLTISAFVFMILASSRKN